MLLVFGDGILDSFREAYWIVAKTLLDLDADGFSYKAAIARMQKSFTMHQLLGQTRRPEGNSAVTFANALSRFAELGYIVHDAARAGWARAGRAAGQAAIASSRLSSDGSPRAAAVDGVAPVSCRAARADPTRAATRPPSGASGIVRAVAARRILRECSRAGRCC